MKYVDLAQHIHGLRAKRTGRPIGAAMRVSEVWNAAIDCPQNGISEILYYETNLPRPFAGMFFRLVDSTANREIAAIYVEKNLDNHWKEFIAIKEMMHCWSPGKSYVGTPKDAEHLVDELCSKSGPYTPKVIADSSAIHAAAEVMLPHFTVERQLALGMDSKQIAFSHGLHPEITEMICRFDLLHKRKNGEF